MKIKIFKQIINIGTLNTHNHGLPRYRMIIGGGGQKTQHTVSCPHP